jgi:hypothetical protein
MADPNKDRRDSPSDLIEGSVDLGTGVSEDGIVDMTVDAVSSIVEIAGEVVGGVFDAV